MHHEVTFVPSGRGKAQCPPNPDYPSGIAIDAAGDESVLSCVAQLPYPAPECGHWKIECGVCGLTVAATAAGRADDPISIRVPCAMSATTTAVN